VIGSAQPASSGRFTRCRPVPIQCSLRPTAITAACVATTSLAGASSTMSSIAALIAPQHHKAGPKNNVASAQRSRVYYPSFRLNYFCVEKENNHLCSGSEDA
jgi:hypothetical protein